MITLDKIYVDGMEFYGYHGVFSEERKLQDYFIDVRIEIAVLDYARDDDFALCGF